MPSAYAIEPIYTNKNKDLLEHLNKAMGGPDIDGRSYLKPKEKKMFSFDRVTRSVTISVPEDTIVVLSDHLANILGFGAQQYFKQDTRGDHMMDPFGDVYSVYVYTDAIQDRRVGDKHAPLLRCVPVDRNRDTGVEAARFPHLDYFPLKSNRLDDIAIYLRDRTGRPIPFLRGEVTVTLHLRPIDRY